MVRRVQYSEDLLKRGDHFFVAMRDPIVTGKRMPLQAPHGFLKRIWWDWFGKKEELKQVIEAHFSRVRSVRLWAANSLTAFTCSRVTPPSNRKSTRLNSSHLGIS